MTTRFGHILVPVDFESPSQRALEVAIDFALTFDSKLTVFHAWDTPQYVYAGMPYVAPEVWVGLEQAARSQLQGTLADVRKRVPRAESVLVRGPAAFEVLAEIERSKVDLIVMGTHGRRGVSRLILGSVAEKVVRGSSVPVLTVRGAEAS
jgi:nucleotide-binding universal stress UspA family protein